MLTDDQKLRFARVGELLAAVERGASHREAIKLARAVAILANIVREHLEKDGQ